MPYLLFLDASLSLSLANRVDAGCSSPLSCHHLPQLTQAVASLEAGLQRDGLKYAKMHGYVLNKSVHAQFGVEFVLRDKSD